MFEPGTLIEKFRIIRPLGDGGMGAVYLAQHIHLGRMAAVKVLHAHVAHHPEIATRFLNEARAAASLEHRNIVGVLDCGQLPDGQWYIALDYLDGEPLARFIHRHQGRPIDLGTIVHVLAEASHGLHVAHEHGIVHRDVKPDNLYLRTDGATFRVVVLDFGIAKLLPEHAQGVQTRDNAVLGTPSYMSLEQMRGSGNVDRRCDIYALGVIVFEMVTGRRPWGEATDYSMLLEMQIQVQLRVRLPPDPREFRPDLPAGLAAAIMRAMDPDPTRRFATAAEFALVFAQQTLVPGWSGSGIAIVERVARELLAIPSEELTVGRRIPSALLERHGVPTARERPAGPVSISDGVPSAPGATAPLPVTPPPAMTTVGSSVGESVPHQVPARGRVGQWLAIAVAAVAGLAAVVVLLVTRDHRSSTKAPEVASTASIPVDAGPRVTPPPDAVRPTTSAVAIVTEPAGAAVTVDGVAKGDAPLNLPLVVGSEVVVRAELAGYAGAEQRVTVTATPGTVRLVLIPVNAGTIPAPETTASQAKTTGKGKHGGDGKKGKEPKANTPTGSGSGSTATHFSPNDVGGD